MGTTDRRKLFGSYLKMDTTIWLSLLIAVVTFSRTASSAEPRVVCYYTNWSVYRPGSAKFNPQNINPYLCTHLIYAFGGFTKENALKPFDKYQDIEKGGYAKFTGLKTYNKNLKTLLAIGGWNEGSARFSPMVASKERRKEFVRNALKFLRQNRFDGLDLDWEYPAFRDGGKPKDRENYAKLVKELREEFEREAEKTGKPRLLLTMAVPAGIEYIQKGFDVKTLNEYLDWMNLLTYDYHSAFEPAVDHHAPLYPLEEPNEYSVDNELNIDYTIKYYLENGADPDKLVLGIPTYGRSYTLFNADATEIGSPADGPGEQGDATREKGYLAYYEICEALKPKEKKPPSSDEDEEDEDEKEDQTWTVVQPNPNAVGPYAYKGNQWVGYDDIDIVRKKAEYVSEKGLGGIMFWSIDNDDFRGNCHGKPYPLIEAAKEAYIASLGRNNFVTEKSRAASTTSNRRKTRPTTRTYSTTTEKALSASRAKLQSTTPAWSIDTPEPPTTPDPGSDFKCKEEGFYPHPRDCKKYFWCLDSGPSNLGIVAHQFTCPSGLYFNKATDSCDFARNVFCKAPKPADSTTKSPTAKTTAKAHTTTTTTAAPSSTTTRKPLRLSTKNSLLFRTTTTTTTAAPELEEEPYKDEADEYSDVEAEDPKVIKDLIDLIKKVGGVEQLEKYLQLTSSVSGRPQTDNSASSTPVAFNKRLYQKVLERTRGKAKQGLSPGGSPILKQEAQGPNSITNQNSRRSPQNAGLDPTADRDTVVIKDRPQYTTIQRNRPSTTESPADEEDEIEEDIQVPSRNNPSYAQRMNRVVDEQKDEEPVPRLATPKPLQYVNIRRGRPTSDTADDTASRNALFERPESIVTVSEPTLLDISSARRENMPEYVTIRRQRPTTEEATTLQYETEQTDEEDQDTLLEKEISSPPSTSKQPQYSTIKRGRPTTTTTSTPEPSTTAKPTTVLDVKIASLLNSDLNEEDDVTTTKTETIDTDPTTTTSAPTTTTSTTTSTTTTPAPSSLATRRTILRRRGTTTTTTGSPPISTSQVSSRRPFLRRTVSTSPSTVESTETDGETLIPELSTKQTPVQRTRKPYNKIPTENAVKHVERRPPSLNSGARSERPSRLYTRRRFGGANATKASTTTSSTSSTTTALPTRRPFRVANRRRPLQRNSRTTTAAPGTTTTSTTEAPTTAVPIRSTKYSEEDFDSPDFHEVTDITILDEEIDSTPNPTVKKAPKVQRRPLILKDEDQNPSATNDDERKRANKIPSSEEKKRESKKYSSKIKQNQWEEVLKQRTQSNDEDLTTISPMKETTVDDFSPETALAIAAHQLLSAPLPVEQNYDDGNSKKKSTQSTTSSYKHTSPITEQYFDSRAIGDYSSTQIPVYQTTGARDYVQTSSPAEYSFSPVYDIPKATPYEAPKTSHPTTFYTNRVTSKSPSYSTTAYPISISPNSISSTENSYKDSEYPSSSPAVDYSSRNPDYPRGSEFSIGPTRNSDYSSTYINDIPKGGQTYSSVSQLSSTSLRPNVNDYSNSPVDPEYPRGHQTYSTTLRPLDDYSSSLGDSDFPIGRQTYSSSSTLRPDIDDSEFPRGHQTYSGVSQSSSTLRPASDVSSNIDSSRARYLVRKKLIPVPVEDYSLAPETSYQSSVTQEPAYFTREYLLESPVTRVYDDEYQYLSPNTTPLELTTPVASTTTPRGRIKPLLKNRYRKISTTITPTTKEEVVLITSPKPRTTKKKIPAKKLIDAQKALIDYRLFEADERGIPEPNVFEDEAKVIVRETGTIECLDVGNFPHPASCRKFISCARMENGSLLGWEYECPQGLSFDPVGGICNWAPGLGCDEATD